MGLFDFIKKKQTPAAGAEQGMLLAMPIFTNGGRYDLSAIMQHLKTFWELDITEHNGDESTAVITVLGNTVAIGFIDARIPDSDIEGTARYADNWPTAKQDLENRTGHAIVSVMSGSANTLERYRLLSKVLYSLIETSSCVGIYQGGQTLLIPRYQYLESADQINNDHLPIDLWIYIGIQGNGNAHNLYTYGLSGFGKKEMEIINSGLNADELYNFLASISAYVIGSNINLTHGETIAFTADQKVKINLSKGVMVNGDSLKLDL